MKNITRLFIAALCAGSFILGTGAAIADNITIPASANSPSITGYMARPSGAGPFPAILVLHGCEGFGSLEKASADELATLGYVALAIDTLKPQGLRNACGGNVTAIRNSAQYAAVSLGWLSSQPYIIGDRLGVLGYSMGAIEILDLIDPFETALPVPPGLRAAVAYYPGCDKRTAANLTKPLLILDGSADDWLNPAPCQALVQAATQLHKSAMITTYPGATHAFNQPSDHSRMVNGHTLTYDPSATADADAKMQDFFGRYLLHAH